MIEIIADMHEVKGRKEHRCHDCDGIIRKHEHHLTGTYKYDDIYTIRKHKACAKFSKKHGDVFRCSDMGIPPIWDWEHGCLPDDIEVQRLELLQNANKSTE